MPAGARAADHLYLDASTRLGGALSGWRLAVHADSGDVYATDEAGEPSPLTRGGYVRVRLVRRAGFVDERHDLIGLPTSDTIAFNGTAGALDVRSELGSSLAIRMTISATGAATPTNALACAGGAFVSVPVRLVGTFALATGTRLFGRLRPSSLSGRLIYNTGGHVSECFGQQVPVCSPGEELRASWPSARARHGPWSWSAPSGRRRSAMRTRPGAPTSAAPPTRSGSTSSSSTSGGGRSRARSGSSACGSRRVDRGSGLFAGRRIGTFPAPERGGVEIHAFGPLEGTFRADFRGWGGLKLPGRMNAVYDTERPPRLHEPGDVPARRRHTRVTVAAAIGTRSI